ncbi:MAG TPA: FG-GAP-like repeat-containing protein [Planctomycetota bacterium]|nr:FG-GAP-like repeat-containing protein [Planctomycetota bacterium]
MKCLLSSLACTLFLLLIAPPAHAGSASYNLGTDPVHITSGDLNGDGFPDLVVASGINADVISILHNDAGGTGAFTAQPNIAGISDPNFVALADFNGDGRLDIVTGNRTAASTTVRVILQNAGGGFAGATVVPVTVGTLPLALVIVDFNGDGRPDIASANNGSNSISIVTNSGSGNFSAPTHYSLTGAPSWIASGDFNSDGFTDLVAAIAAGNRVSMLFGNGDGTFNTNAINIATGSAPRFVSTADFNNDGKIDFGVLLSPTPTSNTISIFLGNGDGTFQNISNNPVFPYNNDGLPDIVNPNFAVADVTRDGKLDLLMVTDVGTAVPSLFGLKGNGDGTFQTATDFQFSVPGVGMFSIAGDLNGDQQPDIATALDNPGTDGVRVELLNPRASISSLSPAKALVNAAGFSLTVNGASFLNGATVYWNGVARTTSFASSTQLSAVIPASDLLTAGRASITVVNPAPGGFASEPAVFTVYETTLGVWTVVNTNDSGSGSLRFCMEQAGNGDTITFDQTVFDLTNSDAATVINVLSELPPLDDGNVILDAQDQRVTLNGSGAGSAAGLVITSSSNIVKGLSLVGFSQSGISIRGGAKSNLIGGTRASGKGPNGNGLRISNCGAFGIEITGSGTDGNSVRGCWIGLDSSGTAAQANIAGILIQNQAKSNVIGSAIPDEANAISGNAFEGVTISGVGTDGNVIIGNTVGAAAIATAPRAATRDDSVPTKAAVGNGSAGVFLSRGTQNSRVGSAQNGEGNTVSFNGGAGIEVRAGNSQRNSASTNSISGNIRGGIGLFDGSNAGIQPPVDDGVDVIAAPGSSVRKVKIRGNASRDGAIEVFNDPGDQGATFLGKAVAAAGRFEIEVDTSTLNKITATLTDANGNTSAFKTFATPVITSAINVTAAVNADFSFAVTASNTPQSYSATGLPPGLSINTSTGIISGIPTAEGAFAVSLTASNSTGTGTASILMTISSTPGAPVITGPATATGTAGFAFTYPIIATGNPTSYAASGLPPGLQINASSGIIGGTPTAAGTFIVNLSATNASGTGTAALTIRIAELGDTDFDGVVDSQEDLVGTDKNSSSDVPVSGGTVVVDKVSVTLNFTSQTKDSIKASLLLILPEGFVTANTKVNVKFGDLVEQFTLDAKGKTPKNLAMLSLKGGSATPGPAKAGVLTFSVKGKSVRTELAAAGLTDKTTAGETLKIPVAVGIITGASKYVYGGQSAVFYKATQGKSGKASKAK